MWFGGKCSTPYCRHRCWESTYTSPLVIERGTCCICGPALCKRAVRAMCCVWSHLLWEGYLCCMCPLLAAGCAICIPVCCGLCCMCPCSLQVVLYVNPCKGVVPCYSKHWGGSVPCGLTNTSFHCGGYGGYLGSAGAGSFTCP